MTNPSEQELTPLERLFQEHQPEYEARLADINAKWAGRLRGFEARGYYDFVYGMGVDENDRLVTVLHGELDAYSSPMIEDAVQGIIRIQQEQEGPVTGTTMVMDAQDVTFLDGDGLRVFLNSQRHLTVAGNKFLLRNPSGPVTRLLEICDLTDRFEYEQ